MNNKNTCYVDLRLAGGAPSALLEDVGYLRDNVSVQWHQIALMTEGVIHLLNIGLSCVSM